MLCSDGLYAALEEIEITPLFDREAQQTAEDLVALVLAKDRQNQDNLTVAILACESDSVLAMNHTREIPPPNRYLGGLVGAVMVGLAVAGPAFWYFFIAPTSTPAPPAAPVSSTQQ